MNSFDRREEYLNDLAREEEMLKDAEEDRSEIEREMNNTQNRLRFTKSPNLNLSNEYTIDDAVRDCESAMELD